MKKTYTFCIVFAAFIQPLLSMGGVNRPAPVNAAAQAKINQWMATHGRLRFLENDGQMADMKGNPVKNLLFKASAGGVDMYITTKGLSYVFTDKKIYKKNGLPGDGKDSIAGQYCRADMELAGADIRKENIIKDSESADYTNYYLGGVCPNGILHVHSYKRITIKNIYPGIDWVIYTAKTGIEYDFMVHPGADPSLIKLRYKWADKPQMQSDGSLKINIPLGNITEGKPVTYQPLATSHNIHTAYTLKNGEIGFALANYDKSKTLVIDPALYWGTYYGGSATDIGTSIWSDGNHVWVTGSTASTNFPNLTNPGGGTYYQGTLTTATENIFILCFNAASGATVWETYYGGTTSGESDQGNGISGDANNIWVVGQSNVDGVTFPTSNPNNYTWYQSWTGVTNNTGLTSASVPSGTIHNTSPGIVLEFSKSTGACLYATFLSGTAGAYNDKLNSVWDDGTDVWVAGSETSADFPVLYSAGYYHSAAFSEAGAAPTFAEFDASSGALLWCTQLGPGATTSTNALSICSDGTYVWLTGCGQSGLPLTDLAGSFYQSTNAGITDGYAVPYIARITISSHTPTWVTYYGGNTHTIQTFAGSWQRTGYGNAIYSNGKNVWFTGSTGSSNLASTTPVALDNPGGGAYYQSTNSVSGTTTGFHAFIAEFSVAGVLQWGTYYGGSSTASALSSEAERGDGIQADINGNVWVTGETESSDFPTLNYSGAYNQSSLGGTQNAFVLQFNTSGAEQWATYYGGNGTDEGNSIFSDGTNLWVTGGTTSTNFPLVNLSGFYNQSSSGGAEDAFVANFMGSTPLPITLTSFTATYMEATNSVLTNWTVATQLNNKYFVVEKTLDGTNYEEVDTVPGAGTTPFSQSYSAIDTKPMQGVSYYRLKQIDMDGHTTVFSPAAVFIGNTASNSIHLYPTPVGETTSLIYNSTDANPLTVDIIDVTGRTVNSFTFGNVQSGENTFPINTSGLSAGVYFLRATSAEKVYMLKFIK